MLHDYFSELDKQLQVLVLEEPELLLRDDHSNREPRDAHAHKRNHDADRVAADIPQRPIRSSSYDGNH